MTELGTPSNKSQLREELPHGATWIGAFLVFLLFAVLAASPDASATPFQPPANRLEPRIEGTPQVGKVLRAHPGRWRRERGLVFTYQWQVCGTDRKCIEIADANDRIYAVRARDIGQTIVVVVTATNDDGGATARSRATKAITAQKEGVPTAEVRPTITGRPEVDSTLTTQTGTWQGEATIEYAFRWRRCTSLGGACVELPQTKPTYVVTTKDQGHTLRVLVRAENELGTGSALSDATLLVPGPAATTPPKNTSPPLVSGVAAEGRTLTASSGSWSGATPILFSFQWLRCDRGGDDCSSISNATRQTHTLSGRDVERTVRVRVTARNLAGTSSATSDRTAVVVGSRAPVNSVAPTISGTAREGSVLTASSGSWKGSLPITFAYQWLRCDSRGGACSAIASATGRTVTLRSADVGKTLRVRVAATNSGGSSAVLSAPIAVVASRGTAPANKSAPILSGVARQGSRLSLSTGSWTGTQPLSFSYRWERCDSAVANCRSIEGATSNTYVLGRADVGHRLRGVVKARNPAGEGSAPSNATAVVVGAPVSTALPKINGTTIEGQTLLTTPGTWTGVGPITYGYQWTRCNAQGEFSSCVPIVVTSRAAYTLRAADVGRRIFVQVKAKNAYGASFVNSDLTGVVAAAPIGTVTVRVARTITVFGQAVTLVGRVVGAPAGERVTIVERPARGAPRVYQNAAVIGPSGTWSFVVRPSLGTSYEVQFRGRTSGPVLVHVRPRLLLRKAGVGHVSLRVFAGRSLAGKTAFLQRWNAKKRRWVTIRRVRLQPSRSRNVAVASVRTHTPRGTYVRFVLPGRQAGPGYVTGTSNRVRG